MAQSINSYELQQLSPTITQSFHCSVLLPDTNGSASLQACAFSSNVLPLNDHRDRINFAMATQQTASRAPNSSSPPITFSPTKDQESAAWECCLHYRRKVVPNLCRGHQRDDDPRLTPTELSRIKTSFFTVWRIVLDLPSESPDIPVIVKEKLASLEPVAFVHAFEMAAFLSSSMVDEELGEIIRLMGYGTADSAHVDVRKVLRHICSVWFDVWKERTGSYGMSQPDYAPLGYWILLDDWQEEYVKDHIELYANHGRFVKRE
jgi:hypothetical protein